MQITSRQNKAHRVKRKRWLNKKGIIVVCCLLLMVAIGSGLYLRNRFQGSNVFTSNVSLPFYRNDEYTYNSKNLFYIKNNELKVLDQKAKEAFSIKDVPDNAKVAATENHVVCYNEKSYKLYSIKDKKEVNKKEGNIQILDIRLGDKYVAVHIREENGSTTMYVYNFEGTEIYKVSSNANLLLDFGFVPANQNLWMMQIDVKSSRPLCNYSAYDVEKNSVTSVINISDQITEKILLNNNLMWAVGTNNIIRYSQIGKKEDTYLVYGWRLADYKFTAQKPTFVLVPRVDENEKIKSVRVRHSDNSEYTFTLQEECFDVIISGEKIYSFTEEAVYLCDLKGNNMTRTNLPFPFKSVEKVMNDTQIIVDTGNGYSLLNVK